MTRHYTTRECFRQMPNKLLARFFQERGLFQALDFTAMKETKPDELFNAWLLLPEENCNEIDAILQEIFELSCEKGYIAIIDEARWQMQDNPEKLAKFIETLSVLPNHYHRAMITYLEHNECWKGATRFYHADTLTYWRKRKYMGHNCAAIDVDSIDQLADES